MRLLRKQDVHCKYQGKHNTPNPIGRYISMGKRYEKQPKIWQTLKREKPGVRSSVIRYALQVSLVIIYINNGWFAPRLYILNNEFKGPQGNTSRYILQTLVIYMNSYVCIFISICVIACTFVIYDVFSTLHLTLLDWI